MASITGLNTREAHVKGGTSIVITGSGFKRATAVKFEDVYQKKYNAQSFTIDSDTQITAVTPSVPVDKRGNYWVLVMVGDKENSVPTKQELQRDGNGMGATGTFGVNYATVSDYERSKIRLTNYLLSDSLDDSMGMMYPEPSMHDMKWPPGSGVDIPNEDMESNPDKPEDESS